MSFIAVMNTISSCSRFLELRTRYSVLVVAVAILGFLGTEKSFAIEAPQVQNQRIQLAANEVADKADSEAVDPAVSERFVQSLVSKALSLNDQFMDLPTDKFRGQIRAANLYIEIEEKATADAALQGAIAAAQELESGTYRAARMAEIALIYGNQLGNANQMEFILRQALALTKAVEPHQVSDVVETVASTYAQTGRYDEAISIIDQFPDVPFIESERKSVIRKAAIHAATEGNHDLAREIILEAEGVVQPEWGVSSAVAYRDRVAATKAEIIDYLTAHYYQTKQFEQGEITAGIESSLIELVSDPLERVDLYLTLAATSSWRDLDDEVLAVLPRAIAATEQLNNEGAGDRDCYLRKADDRFIKIGAMMIKANAIDSGLALLDRIDDVPCAVDSKIQALIQTARNDFDAHEAVQLVTAEIERLIPKVGTHELQSSHWFALADIYLRAGDEVRALEISDRLWQSYQSGELTKETAGGTEQEVEIGYFWGWDYVLSHWVHFLNTAEDYEKAARVAIDIDDQFSLASFVPKLVESGANDLAWEAVEAIDGFDEKVKALGWMSLQYLKLSDVEKAREVLSIAIETVENGDLTELIETDWYYKYDTGEALTQLEKEQTIRRHYLEYIFRLHVLSAGNDSAQQLTGAVSDGNLRQEMVKFVEQIERPEPLTASWSAAGEKLTDEMIGVIRSKMIVSVSYDLWWTPLNEGDYASAVEIALESTPAYARGHALMTIADNYIMDPQPVEERAYEQL